MKHQKATRHADNALDELAKKLASGVSRREALRHLAGGVAGLLVPLGARRAWGDPGAGTGEGCGNICNRQFPPDSRDPDIRFQNRRCKQICATCGPEEGIFCLGTETTNCCPPLGDCNTQGGCFCFIAGTRITMADGSEKLIEQIRTGDLLLGPEGEANRVRGIHTPFLGERALYGFNGEAPCVTAEHPFMTDEGWKSVDPTATARIHRELGTHPLQVGDLLVAMAGVRAPVAAGRVAVAEAVLPRLLSLPLTEVRSREADPQTLLYNLLLDGTHVYFANGFLVHNKA